MLRLSLTAWRWFDKWCSGDEAAWGECGDSAMPTQPLIHRHQADLHTILRPKHSYHGLYACTSPILFEWLGYQPMEGRVGVQQRRCPAGWQLASSPVASRHVTALFCHVLVGRDTSSERRARTPAQQCSIEMRARWGESCYATEESNYYERGWLRRRRLAVAGLGEYGWRMGVNSHHCLALYRAPSPFFPPCFNRLGQGINQRLTKSTRSYSVYPSMSAPRTLIPWKPMLPYLQHFIGAGMMFGWLTTLFNPTSLTSVISWSHRSMASMPDTVALDVLTADVRTLQNLLQNGHITSHTLIDAYLNQIQKHNDVLRAVIETTPRELLLRRAQALDDERRAGIVRGPLHGIPILIKVGRACAPVLAARHRSNACQDNIATHPSLGLGTRAGSLALVGSKPRKNAAIVDMARPLPHALDSTCPLTGPVADRQRCYYSG